MGQPHRVGIIGLGVISKAYLETLARTSDIEVTAVADIDWARATAVAADLPSARALSVADLLVSDTVDVVLNLTIPASHAEVSLAAVEHGKHVYGEKPLAVTFADGRKLIDAARSRGVWVGSAPDTVLGTGTQTARAVIDEDGIGTPTSAQAMLITSGPESWHPNPFFYYQPGGGPMFDMGPYYLSALITLLGPVANVSAMTAKPRTQRTAGAGPRAGETFDVTCETLISATLEHRSGAISSITTSFEGNCTAATPVEVQGTRGTLGVPDPNGFAGEVRVSTIGEGWRVVAPSAGYIEAQRAIGLIDFLRAGPGEARANGDLALHVLEIMESTLRSARERRQIALTTTTERPLPVPLTPEADWTRNPT